MGTIFVVQQSSTGLLKSTSAGVTYFSDQLTSARLAVWDSAHFRQL